jgi:lipopolysaccharide transport system ATP-binding protein
MIMDEVLAVGDMKFQQKCLNRMGEAAGNEGRTVLYVSHNMNTIRQLCTRCVVLDKGRVVFDGDVEDAIAVYMQSNAELMGTDIDLSKSRMGHLPPMIPAKLERVTLVNKTEPVYEFNEDLVFNLKINARREVSNPCIRLEIRNSDDTPVGASYLHDLPAMEAGEDRVYQLCLRNNRLVQGKYKVLLVLYEVNEFGTYNDLDAVWPAFNFEVIDSASQIKLNWDNYSWGRINYEEMELKVL